MEENQENKFKIGDVVRLNSQKYPKMTVESIDLNLIDVVWFDEKKEPRRARFDYALLSASDL